MKEDFYYKVCGVTIKSHLKMSRFDERIRNHREKYWWNIDPRKLVEENLKDMSIVWISETYTNDAY